MITIEICLKIVLCNVHTCRKEMGYMSRVIILIDQHGTCRSYNLFVYHYKVNQQQVKLLK